MMDSVSVRLIIKKNLLALFVTFMIANVIRLPLCHKLS